MSSSPQHHKSKKFKSQAFSPSLSLSRGLGAGKKPPKQPVTLPWIIPGLSVEHEMLVQKQVDFLAEDEFNFRLAPSGHHVEEFLQDFEFDWKHFKSHLLDHLLTRDPQLAHMKGTLVPAFLQEKQFWHNWSARVHIIKLSFSMAFTQSTPKTTSSPSSSSSAAADENELSPSKSGNIKSGGSHRKSSTTSVIHDDIYSSEEEYDWEASTEEMSDTEIFDMEGLLHEDHSSSSGNTSLTLPKRVRKTSRAFDYSKLPPPPVPPIGASRSADSIASQLSSEAPSLSVSPPAQIDSGSIPEFNVNRKSLAILKETAQNLLSEGESRHSPVPSSTDSQSSEIFDSIPASPRSNGSAPIADSSTPFSPVFSKFVRRDRSLNQLSQIIPNSIQENSIHDTSTSESDQPKTSDE